MKTFLIFVIGISGLFILFIVLVALAFIGMHCINKAWEHILGENGRDE